MAIVYSFSGHRPDKLGGWDWDSQFNKRIRGYFKDKLDCLIEEAHGRDITFVSGMAEGFDQFMVSVLLELRNAYSNILIVAAVPFRDQHTIWREESIARYNTLLSQCDIVVNVDDLPNYKMKDVAVGEYHRAKYLIRNQYMIDIMDRGIVLWDGSLGGTGSFVASARKANKLISITSPRDI